MNDMSLSDELKWRGFVNQTTFDDITELDKDPISFYFGVDPSANSMTIGNLASAMMVRHFINHGHRAFLLVGGATGMIGDPDGKSSERNLLTLEQIETNKQAISEQYRRVFDGQSFEIVDNYDWFKDMHYLTFLRDVGKHVPMRTMLGRDFVQSRLSEGGSGISYAEFSYSLIQGYDFLHLYKNHGVSLQVCGADQWGNSIAGVDLIRRIEGGQAHVYSAPLIVNKATGKKFGKTEDGAIWLDSKLTSVFKFYQFWLNADDDGVIDYLKVYTLLSREEIENIEKVFNENRSDRAAQKALAYEATKLVHGQEQAESAKKVTEILFGIGDLNSLSDTDWVTLKEELPLAHAQLGATNLVDAVLEAGLAESKGEARRFVTNGAIYVNGNQIDENKTTFDESDNISGYAVIRRGKNTSAIVEF